MTKNLSSLEYNFRLDVNSNTVPLVTISSNTELYLANEICIITFYMQ